MIKDTYNAIAMLLATLVLMAIPITSLAGWTATTTCGASVSSDYGIEYACDVASTNGEETNDSVIAVALDQDDDGNPTLMMMVVPDVTRLGLQEMVGDINYAAPDIPTTFYLDAVGGPDYSSALIKVDGVQYLVEALANGNFHINGAPPGPGSPIPAPLLPAVIDLLVGQFQNLPAEATLLEGLEAP